MNKKEAILYVFGYYGYQDYRIGLLLRVYNTNKVRKLLPYVTGK